MKTALLKSFEVDGVPVEIRIDLNNNESDENLLANFIYELLCK